MWAMSIQSSSSTESSPSLYSHPAHPSVDDAGAAHFNPLFIYTASAAHINHNHNHSFNLINNTSTNKMAGNTSPNPMHPQEGSSRRVHVVYYLSRSGQLEHPHLLEVSIPPNQGLHLRDVKKRLAAIRGKRLPMTFAWSYKRSYKNGYVWQDLCDDDLIFPAHGCEYVLKGSEIMNDQSNNEECGHTPSRIVEGRLAPQNGSKEDQGITNITLKAVYQDDEESQCAAVGSASLRVSMVESGTDAATQTEENLRPSTSDDMHEQETASKRMYTNLCTLSAKQSSICSPHKTSCTTTRPQHATELNKGDIASPPSSSSTANSPSPYKEIPSTSSSSASGFNTATDHNDNIGSNDQTNIRNCNLGSKTPGRSWMKRGIHKLEEQDEVISLHAIEDEGECESIMNDGGSTNSAHENSNNKTKHRSMGGNSTIAAAIVEDVEHSPLAASAKPSRGKHSGALSLLQFMSCGGLDIKEQILPMSLYRLRSKGAPASTANQLHMSNYTLSPEHLGTEAFGYGGSEAGNLWTRIGKPKSLYLNSSKRLYNASDEYNGTSDVDNQQVHRRHHYSQHEGASVKEGTSPSPMANGSSALKAQGGNIPDVISIGRSSISDRSTNVSHELEYQVAEAHSKLKKSGEVINKYGNIAKSSPQFNVRLEVPVNSRNSEGIRPTTSMGAVARAVSGEILMSKGSPLFVPGKRHLSYSGTPLNYAGSNKPPLAQLSTSVLQLHEAGNNQISTKLDAQNKACSSSCNPSRAFSEGEVSCMLANRNAMSKSGDQRSMAINGYDQSMAQLWEELLAAPAVGSKSEEHQHNDADYQRVRQVTNMVGSSSSSSSWEVERDQRTLQNAVELSLQPPLEHLMLHHQPHHHHHLLDCPQCGRKVKAEVLKAHVKTCSSPKSNTKNSIINNCMSHNNNGFGKSPKSDSNLCQRFLRASPPPPPPI